MSAFQKTGSLEVGMSPEGSVDDLFLAGNGTTQDTLDTIKRYHEQYHYLLDPHTAVGVSVGEKHLEKDIPMICLATAHPAKFSKAIQDATGQDLAHHEILDRLEKAETRCKVLPADEHSIRAFMEENVS